jgi:hypothetical protein
MHHRLQALSDRPKSSQGQQVHAYGSQRGHDTGAVPPGFWKDFTPVISTPVGLRT